MTAASESAQEPTMSDYTPTTEQVRDSWTYTLMEGVASDESKADADWDDDRMAAQFDRWLAAHDRQVEAEALRTHRRTVERWYANSGQKSLVGTAIVLGDLADRADRIENGDTND